MGSAFGTGFTALANQLALAGLGVATLGLVVLGLGLRSRRHGTPERRLAAHHRRRRWRRGVVHHHEFPPLRVGDQVARFYIDVSMTLVQLVIVGLLFVLF